MPIDILMPALSPTMEEGKLAKWLKAEGDTVSAGDVIAEIETDKATMEVEAVDEGTLGKILVAEGTDNVKVNEKIAILLGEGEDASAADSAASAPAAAPQHCGRRCTCCAVTGRCIRSNPTGAGARDCRRSGDPGRHVHEVVDRPRSVARCDGRRNAPRQRCFRHG
jgi:pyruvate/2-oxoglutarate dehydrogenase complex dihydrolipoamide acyltransferase (E2) component